MCKQMAEFRELLCKEEKNMYVMQQIEEHWAFWINETAETIEKACVGATQTIKYHL